MTILAVAFGVMFVLASKTHAQVVVDGTGINSNTTTNWFGVMGVGASFNQNGGFAVNPTFRLGNTPVSLSYTGSLPGTYAQQDNRNWRNAVLQQAQYNQGGYINNGYTNGSYYQDPNRYVTNQNFGYTQNQFGNTYGNAGCVSYMANGCPRSNTGYSYNQFNNGYYGVPSYTNAGDRNISQWQYGMPYTTPYTYGGQGYGI